jgi:hypothetical protein
MRLLRAGSGRRQEQSFTLAVPKPAFTSLLDLDWTHNTILIGYHSNNNAVVVIPISKVLKHIWIEDRSHLHTSFFISLLL